MTPEQTQAMTLAKEMVVYLESEQSDLKAQEKVFDALWQSIYDVCKLVNFGILDDISEEEYDQGVAWLKQTQDLTEDYGHINIEL